VNAKSIVLGESSLVFATEGNRMFHESPLDEVSVKLARQYETPTSLLNEALSEVNSILFDFQSFDTACFVDYVEGY
jgi:hypothetical protein